AIPVGQAMHKNSVDTGHVKTGLHGWHEFWSGFDDLAQPVARRSEAKAMKQLGTLGGGNHFIELCLSDDGQVWLMLHSGSRNIGKELAEHHIGIAQKLPHNQG
ncbi:Fis family transcriptional regulator, partial [Thermoactinomyces vulgaris]